MATTPDRSSPPAGGDLRLPRPPGMVRRFWTRHPWWADSLVAAAYLVPALLGSAVLTAILTGGPAASPALIAVGFCTTLAAAAALLFRRHRPRTVLAATWAIMLASGLAWSSVDFFATLLALYALAVYSSARAAWIGFGVSTVVGVAASYLAEHVSPVQGDVGSATLPSASAIAITGLVAVLIGINIGNRRRYVVALLDRAQQLARERDQQAQLAAAAERSRIAREMHDIVSHGLTVRVTLAEGSAASAAADPDRAAAAMRAVAESGRQALTDMRRMLGVLNNGGGEAAGSALEPQPGVADLGRLVEGFRTAGMPVRFSSEGVPPQNQAEQLTVYRIVQEALTNALRHAVAPTGVRAAVRYSATTVAITVTDDGARVEAPATPAGNGLVGMRERVALYGGTVRSGPRAAGGWSVEAVLHHEPPESPPARPSTARESAAQETTARERIE